MLIVFKLRFISSNFKDCVCTQIGMGLCCVKSLNSVKNNSVLKLTVDNSLAHIVTLIYTTPLKTEYV